MENQTQATVMTVKDWMITLLISFIPLVGIIMIFVWAFGSGENPNKSNWAKATLIWIGILIVVYIIIAVIFGAVLIAIPVLDLIIAIIVLHRLSLSFKQDVGTTILLVLGIGWLFLGFGSAKYIGLPVP